MNKLRFAKPDTETPGDQVAVRGLLPTVVSASYDRATWPVFVCRGWAWNKATHRPGWTAADNKERHTMTTVLLGNQNHSSVPARNGAPPNPAPAAPCGFAVTDANAVRSPRWFPRVTGPAPAIVET